MPQSPGAAKPPPPPPPPAAAEDEDDEDPWVQRIRLTGCAAENERLLDCHAASKDWRVCRPEMAAFRECMERHTRQREEARQ